MSYIYKITNKTNGMMYVGNTSYDIQKRWKEHCRDSRKQRYINRPLYADMQKYGTGNFTVTIIEKCSQDISQSREIYWIKKLNTFKEGYNCTFGGNGKSFIDHELLLNTYRETKSIKRTAEILGVSIDSVADIIHAAGIKTPPNCEIAKIRGATKPVIALTDNGEVINTFDSLALAAKWLTCKHKQLKSIRSIVNNISRACKKDTFRAYGFAWRFEDV